MHICVCVRAHKVRPAWRTCVGAVGRQDDKHVFQWGLLLSLRPRRRKRQTTLRQTFILIILSAKLFTPCIARYLPTAPFSTKLPFNHNQEARDLPPSSPLALSHSLFSLPFVFSDIDPHKSNIPLHSYFLLHSQQSVHQRQWVSRWEDFRKGIRAGPSDLEGLRESLMEAILQVHISHMRTPGTAQATCTTAAPLTLLRVHVYVWQSQFFHRCSFLYSLILTRQWLNKIKNILSRSISIMHQIISLIV